MAYNFDAVRMTGFLLPESLILHFGFHPAEHSAKMRQAIATNSVVLSEADVSNCVTVAHEMRHVFDCLSTTPGVSHVTTCMNFAGAILARTCLLLRVLKRVRFPILAMIQEIEKDPAAWVSTDALETTRRWITDHLADADRNRQLVEVHREHFERAKRFLPQYEAPTPLEAWRREATFRMDDIGGNPLQDGITGLLQLIYKDAEL